MRTQGGEMHTASAFCTDDSIPGGSVVKKRRKRPSFDAVVHAYQADPVRCELLNSIKNRIRSGFYNTESVIDDLGHGFAQALDPTL